MGNSEEEDEDEDEDEEEDELSGNCEIIELSIDENGDSELEMSSLDFGINDLDSRFVRMFESPGKTEEGELEWIPDLSLKL
jgi:hypothetical protein